MPKEYSPFTPGIPVPIEFFVGRAKEIEGILGATRKSFDSGSLERIFVIGERGIGKSSLCKLARTLAERDLNALSLHVFLGGVNTLEEMARRIFERLLNDGLDKPWYDAVKRFLGDHVRKVGIFGITVEFDASEKELSRAVNDFVPALRNLLAQIKENRRGILLILDDLNGLASNERFANWLKSIVDEIATGREPIPLTLVLVGLPERRMQLIEQQPSLDRVFDLILIDKFSEQESSQFFKQAFTRMNTAITPEALDILNDYSSGYPVLMHEIGDAAFQIDEDGKIDDRDAIYGIERAARIVGSKYLEPRISAAIRSDKYQSILKKISLTMSERFTKGEVTAKLNASEIKVFDNFLRRMRDLGVIRSDRERGPGNYEFTRKIYSIYLFMQASAGEHPSDD